MSRCIPWTLVATLVVSGCSDPTHDRAVEALGGEAAHVPPGPLHRPGQPCVTCHGDSGPASSEFSMAGTVYQLFRDNAPAAGVLVLLEDITGQAKTATTNAAGNFYLEPSEWNPTYPVTVKVQLGTVTKQMSTDIARAASCAECHRDPPNQTSPGHVYVAVNATELAKAQGGQ